MFSQNGEIFQVEKVVLFEDNEKHECQRLKMWSGEKLECSGGQMKTANVVLLVQRGLTDSLLQANNRSDVE